MKTIFALFISLFLFGCASSGKHPNTWPIATPVAANKNQARVIITRDSAIIASPQDVLITVDGREVCVIPNGQTCEFATTPGAKRVDIYAKTFAGNVDPSQIRLNFVAGKTYQFAVGPKDMTGLFLAGGIGEMISDAANASEQKGRFRLRSISE